MGTRYFTIETHFCKKCNLPLDLKVAFEMQKRIEMEDEVVLKILSKRVTMRMPSE
jgi:hypothetical protein